MMDDDELDELVSEWPDSPSDDSSKGKGKNKGKDKGKDTTTSAQPSRVFEPIPQKIGGKGNDKGKHKRTIASVENDDEEPVPKAIPKH